MTIVGICLSPLIPYTHWHRSLCSLLLPIFTALPSSLTHPDSAFSVHSSYHSLLPSPHPLHTLTALSLFPPPTNFSCPPVIPCTPWQCTLCSLLLPLFAALPSSLAYPDSTFSFQSSYHSLLPFPHHLHNLTALSLFTAPTTLWFSPLITCTPSQQSTLFIPPTAPLSSQSLKFMFYTGLFW